MCMLMGCIYVAVLWMQVWVGSVSRGPNSRQLLGTYEHAETFAYQDEIGQVLLSVCRVGVFIFLMLIHPSLIGHPDRDD